MRIELTKEMKVTLLQILKQGYITNEQAEDLNKALGNRSELIDEIPKDKLDKIEKILYPD